jgi:Zn ribbon nucleic-acid-binding protein
MSVVSPRLPPKCAHCKTIQTTPEWSETGGENEVVYFWRCTACGHEFETKDHSTRPQMSRDELAEEFLPNLVVE